MRYNSNFALRRARQPIVMTGILLLAFALLIPDTAHAADNIFGTNSPLQRFITFITGIFAYMMVIVGIVITLGGLILGSDMSGFSRRAPLVVVAGAVLILADVMVGALFGAQGGYELPETATPPVPPHPPAQVYAPDQSEPVPSVPDYTTEAQTPEPVK